MLINVTLPKKNIESLVKSAVNLLIEILEIFNTLSKQSLVTLSSFSSFIGIYPQIIRQILNKFMKVTILSSLGPAFPCQNDRQLLKQTAVR